MSIKGKAPPASQVIFYLQDEQNTVTTSTVLADQNGRFIFVSDKRLPDGQYIVWAEIADSTGAKSLPSTRFDLTVRKPIYWEFGGELINILAVAITILALLLLLFLIFLFAWRKWKKTRDHIRREIDEAEESARKEFNVLKESVGQQVAILERRKATKQASVEEEQSLERIKSDLGRAEQNINKELKNVKKEVN